MGKLNINFKLNEKGKLLPCPYKLLKLYSCAPERSQVLCTRTLKKNGIICLFWVCQDQAWALCFSEFARTGLYVSVPLVHYLYLSFCYCTKGFSISSLSVQNLQLLIKNADLVFFPQLHKSVQCAEETLEAAFLVKHHRWFSGTNIWEPFHEVI